MKIKVRYKRTSLLRQLEDEESDTYCIPADDEDFSGDESNLDCFTMSDDPDNIEDIGNFTSDNIDIPENATTLSDLDIGNNLNSGNNSNNDNNLNSDNNSNNDNNSNSDNNSNNGNITNKTSNGNDDNNNSNSTSIVRSYAPFYRSKSSDLSAGAIVGIVLGSIVAIALIIAIILLARKQSVAAPEQNSEASKVDSHFNLKV